MGSRRKTSAGNMKRAESSASGCNPGAFCIRKAADSAARNGSSRKLICFCDRSSRVRKVLICQRGQPLFHHLRQAAQFALDDGGLAHQRRQNPILGPLGVVEIMAIHGVARLQLAVDAAVALFHPARIPGHVHVEQIPALSLQVQPFAGGVGSDQNPYRMVARIGVEGALDRLAFLGRGRAVIDGDAFPGAVAPGDGAVQLLAQIALGVVVLGEQDHPRLGPARRGRAGRHGPAQRWQFRAQPGADPVHQLADAGIGLRAGGVGDGGHALQQRDFLGERGLVAGGSWGHGRRHGRCFHLRVFLGLQRGQPLFHHLRQAAQFALDDGGLAHQRRQNPIL
ncbi:MAG: hypothetical protein H6R23_2920, partial [Proteobacteria bacterium]|nr:hypothetical protein [Pseudomonadota bacterium]